MKILQICAAYKPAFIYGGPTMSVSMLSENLVKAGINTAVYATTANGKNELPVIPGDTVIVDGVPVTYFKRVTKDHSHFSPSMFKQLSKEAKRFNLVHIHAWWNLVSIFSCFIAIRQKIPVLLSPRGTLSPYSFKNKSIGVKWLMHHLIGKNLLKKCHIHATSEREAEAITRLFKPKSITILPNFVRLSLQKEFPKHVPSSIVKLIFFSRVEEKKGLDILLSALAKVNIPYTLTIAGGGDADYITALKKITIDNHIEDKVNWIGFQNENKFELLQAHDLFILPSYDENFGNAVIESLSVGTPVLISEQVGLAGYVINNNLGWVCQTDPLSLANKINDIFNNQTDDLTTIRKDAPKTIISDFKEEVLAKKYINLYDELIIK